MICVPPLATVYFSLEEVKEEKLQPKKAKKAAVSKDSGKKQGTRVDSKEKQVELL